MWIVQAGNHIQHNTVVRKYKDFKKAWRAAAAFRGIGEDSHGMPLEWMTLGNNWNHPLYRWCCVYDSTLPPCWREYKTKGSDK
jgi:hypothetical protein